MAFSSVLGADGYLLNGLLLVHCEWIQKLINSKKTVPKNEFTRHPDYSDDNIRAFLNESRIPPCPPGKSNSWRLLSVEQFSRRNELVRPLVDIHRTVYELPEEANLDEDGCFSEVLDYIEQTNFASMWQSAFTKWPSSFKMQNEIGKYSRSSKYESGQFSSLPYDIVLLEAIGRAYGCPIIDARSQTDKNDRLGSFEMHFKRIQLEVDTMPPFHVDHALLAILCDYEIVLLKPYEVFNMRHALRLSPAFLENTECPIKQLFVIFQVFNAVRNLHKIGLALGDIQLHDIQIDKHCLVSLKPHLESNLIPYVDPTSEITLLKVPKVCNCQII